VFRCAFLILVSAACLAAQIRWTCDPKDGKFVATPCAACQKFYCWDGQIFSEERGYPPPPSYVLAYWEEVHRNSQQIRADIDRRGKELKEKVEKAKQETARLNQERAQAHQEFMDDLHRRMNDMHPSSGGPRTATTASARRVAPKDTVVVPVDPGPAAPALPPISRVKAEEIRVGMDRDAVEALLGKPHSAISIPDEDGLVESFTYLLDDQATARVRIEQGKVVSVKISN